jgi:hypothetical protein
MSRTIRKVMVVTKRTYQKVGRFMSGGVQRIFRLSDNDYPTTGVQPFSGDVAKEN